MNKILKIFKKKYIMLLLLICVLGTCLRILCLSDLPVSPYWDEVSIGYNAYSVSQTLNDEYGKRLPILFKAYNDYKLPLYIYVDSFFVKIMGLSVISVRLPSAIFGVLSIFTTFFLVRKLFEKTKFKFDRTTLALVSSFLLAISPWHIQFSRGGFEANLALFFVILGIFLFLKYKDGSKYLLLSFISFALTFYTYRSSYLFVPFILLGLVVVLRKGLLKVGWQKLILIIAVFVVLVTPITVVTFTKGNSRASQTSISLKVDELSNKYFESGRPENRYIVYSKVFISNYLSQISPSFLFISGDPNGRHSTRGMGVINLWELPFLIIGIIILILKAPFKAKMIILFWLLASPIPVALTIPSPHALRGLNGVVAFEILVALGLCFLMTRLSKKSYKITFVILSLIIFVSFIKYIALYKSSSLLTASEWGDGYRQLYDYLSPIEGRYDKIIVSGHYWQPYAYALFYSKYNPYKYQENGSPVAFGKYFFGGTSWDKNIGRDELDKMDLKMLFPHKKVLVALSPSEYESQKNNIVKLFEIRDLNNKIVYITGKLK